MLEQPLFEGPLDVVGDIHGEIDALRALLGHLGYDADGRHPDGRRLVFVGDLTDRGPDSIAAVDLVQRFIESGRAQCVLGNHDLNILLLRRKFDNNWFYGEEFEADGRIVPQKLADEPTRERILAFFRSLPIALVRDDLRVIHACWDDAMIAIVREAPDAKALHDEFKTRIDAEIQRRGSLDPIDAALLHQNQNPVKLLTSGLEEPADAPTNSSGKQRVTRRVPWWRDYTDGVACVFGHYSIPPDEPRGAGRAFCVDYAVGKRWMERREVGDDGPFRRMRLAALRFPDGVIVLDDGERRVWAP